MSGTVSEALCELGLSETQAARFVALQETGRNVDFLAARIDQGETRTEATNRYDEFTAGLKAFSGEDAATEKLGAALWDHLAPRIVPWRPGFLEGVEASDAQTLLDRSDRDIDAKLDRHVPQATRNAWQDTKSRFDDLLATYEIVPDAGTRGKIIDEMAFIASLEEKIRRVVYYGATTVDLRKTFTQPSADSETQGQARAYEAMVAKVSDVLDQLRSGGVEIRTGIMAAGLSEIQPRSEVVKSEEQIPRQPRVEDVGRGFDRLDQHNEVQSLHRPNSTTRFSGVGRQVPEAATYWRDVAGSSSEASATQQTETLIQSTRRGRTL